MKLNDYAIRQCLAECNWKAATDIVAANFDLQMPQDYEVKLISEAAWLPAVVIYSGALAYRWHSAGGFYKSQYSTVVFKSGMHVRINC
jgi:hypothetical protein